MNRVKKIIIPIIAILLLILGGVFYWKNQQDVKELNTNLPEGVRVVKTLNGKYKVVNKIDGYEFKVPEEWGGIEEIEYIAERNINNMKVVSIGLEGVNGYARILSLDVYYLNGDVDLKQWAKNLLNTFELKGILLEETIKNFTTIKTKEEEHLGGTYIYFLQNDLKVYVLNNGSEEFIQDIIINGKW